MEGDKQAQSLSLFTQQELGILLLLSLQHGQI